MYLLLADENFALPVVSRLRSFGYDIVTLKDLGLADQQLPDDKVLEKAIELQRAVITFNRKDFIKLHRTNDQHYGIIIATFDTAFSSLAGRIHLQLLNTDSIVGKLIRVTKG